MEDLVTPFIVVASLLTITLIVVDHIRGNAEILSIRNIALVGFLIFQVFSTRLGLTPRSDFSYNLNAPEETVGRWVVWCSIFLVAFAIAYRVGFGAKFAARFVPVPSAKLGMASGWALMLLLTACAGALKILPIPYVAALANYTSVGLASVSAGIAGWLWAPRLFNPAIAIPAIAIVGINAFVVQIGEFGRRPLVSIGAGMLWGMYYSSFRYLSFPNMMARAALVTIPPAMLLGAYTSVRSWGNIGSGQQIVSDIVEDGDATVLFKEMFAQDTTVVGQWLMEYADRGQYETRPLFSIRYFFEFPIPRQLYEFVGAEKPWPVSTQMADLSNRKGVKRGNTGVTNPAGVVGNATVEGGVFALIIYAIVGAAVFRFFDQYLRNNPRTPYLVLPIGSCLGQVLGIARGEVPVFMFIFVWTTGTVTITMIYASKILTRMFPQLAEADEVYDIDETGEYFDYGAEGYADYGEETYEERPPRLA